MFIWSWKSVITLTNLLEKTFFNTFFMDRYTDAKTLLYPCCTYMCGVITACPIILWKKSSSEVFLKKNETF